ncbi:MAG TPA: hypothetical protein VMV18_11975 [bacterium]|nr:hypothetical protein [bacterium]
MKPATAILLLVVAGATVAALWLLSHKPPGDPRSTAALASSWRGDARQFTLREDGLYWAAALGSAGTIGAATECGRWQASDGILTLRATWTAASTSALDAAQLHEPGMHLGAWEGSAPAEITLVSAEPGASKTERRRTERLRRAPAPDAALLPAETRKRLDAACGLRL